ncbi:hypothetical protein ACWN8P_10005 [Vagococcus salmoninarum]|uniref:Uncharacterized protein n=1 Tax=Vagococcus salmoninarum TaxID=2739 RepID=A0A429ZJV8_9ENTE|nr:hypothetical protein [Vagococcus salmoninarum]RST93990.1 hypothetical protein CBF35_11080 [Vagococcus salmoninarum]
MENDFIMRQIKLMGEGIGILFKKKISSESLGEIQSEEGTTVSRMDLLLEYIADDRISEAVLLVNSLKYKMSVYDFQNVSHWFLNLLKDYQGEKPDLLSNTELEHYRSVLNDLL